MVLAFFLVLWAPSVVSLSSLTPVQKYIALENQKVLLFDYGKPFKLHKRTRAELFKAAAGQ